MRVSYQRHVYWLEHEGDLIRFWMLLRRQGKRNDLARVA